MRTMSRRGLTMIETLAALGLLALLIPAALSWTIHTTRLHRENSARATWHAAAEAVLQRIHDDLNCGDFTLGMDQRRVVVVEGVLLIQTRSRGPAVHCYEWNLITRTLHRIEVRLGKEQSRLLLGDITSFDVQMDIEEGGLEVQLVGVEADQSVARRFRL